MWPLKLVAQLTKLARNYELIVYTILPSEIVSQIYDKVPELRLLVSHTLTYEDMTFSEENFVAYKDIGLLASNRISSEQEQMETMVVDIKKASEIADLNYLTYFQLPEYKAKCAYNNLAYLHDTLKQYRKGVIEGIVNQ